VMEAANYVPLWVALIITLPAIINAIGSLMLNAKLKRTEDHVVETKAKVTELEKNTNGRLDELLKLTGESSEAKGNLAGRAEAKAEADKP